MLVFWLAATTRLAAQQYEFNFLPIKDLAVEQQNIVGKLGDHLFLQNHQNPQALELLLYNISTQNSKTRNYPFPTQKMVVLASETTLLFVSTALSNGVLTAWFLEIDQQGEVVLKKEMPLPMNKPLVHLLPSADKKHILFYQLSKRNPDSSFINGVIASAAGEQKKQLSYSFRHSTELDMEPVVFLDNHANTHVLVTDKYSNYRISGDLTLNTIPFAEEQIISETFSFNQVKLRDLRVFQNNECSCLQAEGMYVSGLDKHNKGIYSIAFPPGRKNELAPRFIPFQPDMIRQFRAGFSATDETIQKNLEIQDILYSDSGSYVIARLNVGVPQKLSSLNTGGTDASSKAVAQSLAIGRANDLQPVLTTNPVVTNTTQRTRGPRRNGSDVSPESSSSMVSGSGSQYQSPLSSRASGRNAPKFVCIKLDKELGFSWYTTRSLDIFSTELYNKPLLAGPAADALTLIIYQPGAQDEPYPVFIDIHKGKQVPEKIPVKKLLFSPPTMLTDNRFGAIYLNTETFEGGILLANRKTL